MTGAARLFFILAIVYAVAGMLLGLSMAISQDHTQHVTHAHIMLAGWVSTAIFAFFYHLFPDINKTKTAQAHFWFQTASTVLMVGSLLLLYGGNPAVEPGAAIGSIGYALGVLFFAWNAMPVLKTA
jgi:cbb3-type cytochrome oxidase subunit 1